MKRKIKIIIILLLFFSSNLIGQWEKCVFPHKFNSGIAMDSYDKKTSIFSTDNLNIYMTLNNGSDWGRKSIPDKMAIDISMVDSLNIWLCSAFEIYHTYNGGKTWELQFEQSAQSSFNYIEMFNLNEGVAMADAPDGVSSVIILKTSNGGTNWIPNENNMIGGLSGDLWRRIDFVDPQIGYFFVSGPGHGKLYKTEDGGSTWVPTNYPENHVKVIKFYNEEIGLAISGTGNVMRTLNGSENWEEYIRTDQGCENDIEFFPGDPSRVWTVGILTTDFSSDTGKSYMLQLETPGRDIVVHEDLSGWLLSDEGIFYTTDATITSIEKDKLKFPGGYLLTQNFPNPFNPATVIRYHLPKNSQVFVRIYNIQGQEIRILVDEKQRAGDYSVIWDGLDRWGKEIASGVYFYRIEAINSEGIFLETRKMIKMQ